LHSAPLVTKVVSAPATTADASALPSINLIDNFVFYLSIFGVTVCVWALL